MVEVVVARVGGQYIATTAPELLPGQVDQWHVGRGETFAQAVWDAERAFEAAGYIAAGEPLPAYLACRHFRLPDPLSGWCGRCRHEYCPCNDTVVKCPTLE